MKTETLTEFLAAQKPEWCIALDVLLTAQLLLTDGQPYPGHKVLAARCGLSDDKAIVRSLGRLRASGWIVKIKTEKDEVEYSVQVNKLPRKEVK
jgi:hypothetical protein